MGREELTLGQIAKGGGKFYELGRTAITAALGAQATVEDARLLWSEEFQGQVAQILVGTHKIVPKTPEEIVRTERRPHNERKEAVSLIKGQSDLRRIATDQTLPDWIRCVAFCRVEDEKFVADCAKTSDHGDATDERLLTMNDEELLYDVAMNAVVVHAAAWAAKRLVTISPKTALRVAVESRRDHGRGGIYYIGTWIAREARQLNHQTLLDWIIADDRTPAEVVKAARET